MARLESWEVRDGGLGPAGDRSAGPGRRGERRVIRLADCVSVLPADGESCPRDTGAFLLTTTERSHLLAAQHRQAWMGSICQLAFPGTGESSSGAGEAEAPKRGLVPMEENSIYSSWQEGESGRCRGSLRATTPRAVTSGRPMVAVPSACSGGVSGGGTEDRGCSPLPAEGALRPAARPRCHQAKRARQPTGPLHLALPLPAQVRL